MLPDRPSDQADGTHLGADGQRPTYWGEDRVQPCGRCRRRVSEEVGVVDAPLVSVLMLAYNHERFVGEAVSSVLAQRDVELELLVGDDASTDGTGRILQGFANEDPARVSLVPRPRNIGMFANFADLWSRARGKYIAILEADDFWVSPSKLAEQTRAMELNPHWPLAFHRVKVIDDHGRPLGHNPADPRGPFDWPHLVQENFIQTCSVVYRGGVVPAIPTWLSDVALLDWPVNLLHVMHGPPGYLDGEWAVYRQHEGGAWSTRPPVERLVRSAEMLRRVAAKGGCLRRTRTDLMRSRSTLLLEAVSTLWRDGEVGASRRLFWRHLADPLDRSRFRSRLRMLADLYVPHRNDV